MTVDLSVKDNSGFSSFIVDLTYDNRYLEPISVIKLNTGDVNFDSGSLFPNNYYQPNIVRAMYYGYYDNVFNGDILRYSFNIIDAPSSTVDSPLLLGLDFISSLDISVPVSTIESDGKVTIVVAEPNPVDVPILSNPGYNRSSDTTATIGFSTNKAGVALRHKGTVLLCANQTH